MSPIQTEILEGDLWLLPSNFNKKVWKLPEKIGWNSIETCDKGYRALLVDKQGRIYGNRKIQCLIVNKNDSTKYYGQLSVFGKSMKAWLTTQLILAPNGIDGYMMHVLEIDDLPTFKKRVVTVSVQQVPQYHPQPNYSDNQYNQPWNRTH